MAGFVSHRVIRVSCRVALLSIFVLFVVNQVAGLAGNGPLNSHQLPPKLTVLENVGEGEIGSNSSSSTSVRGENTSRPAATSLQEGVGEDVRTQNGKDAGRKLYSQESNFDGGEILQPLDLSPEGGSELEAAIPVQKATVGSACTEAWEHPVYSDSCSYVRATPECSLGTLIEYTEMYFCVFSGTPVFAYVSLILFLAALFYTLGHTADHFFCASMDKLSLMLGMSSILAGVTLLPFGNGAPDVFASVAAFASSSGQGQVGLNSVLGGAMFVSTVVAGSVGLRIMSSGSVVELDRRAFLRDVSFFLFALTALTIFLSDGNIHFSEAVAYVSIYLIYVSMVLAEEFMAWRFNRSNGSLGTPLLPGIYARNGSVSSEL